MCESSNFFCISHHNFFNKFIQLKINIFFIIVIQIHFFTGTFSLFSNPESEWNMEGLMEAKADEEDQNPRRISIITNSFLIKKGYRPTIYKKILFTITPLQNGEIPEIDIENK